MDSRADLHVHTTASDGALTPTEVVREAKRVGLAAVGIADHDTADGIEEALAAAETFGVEVVPGIEISTTQNSTEVHILGYFIDHRNRELLDEMARLKQARFERARLIVEKLRAAGIPIRFDRVLEIARGGAVGRPHIARAIWEAGAASSVDAAFGKFLQPGGPGYVPRPKLLPEHAIELIRTAGGVPCCAHAAKLRRDELILELIHKGLMGIEVYHPDHTAAASRFYKRFAEKHSLVAVGGSDAHCIPGTTNGGIGSVTVEYGVVEQLRSLSDDLRRARQ
ncbi:MAG: PHP domain-containing protein [Armatimonadota bacterium]|nr:PHP domain-containing protein [Armatimonadota bacterium]